MPPSASQTKDENLHLFGGEPLLHPRINDFSHSARKHFSDTRILIITNGMLLPQMPELFWQRCREDDIVISVTKYPIDIDYKSFKGLAERQGVTFEFYGIATEKKLNNINLDPSGSQNPYESFSNCYMANNCIRLKNGKIATCSPILNIEFFNKYFNTHIEICPDDYIDIYSVKSAHEIISFVSKPVPFCRYCDVNSRTYDNPWRISRKCMQEWTGDVRQTKE